MSDQPFESVRPRRAVDEIMDQIRERIRNHDLLPGQKLPSERDLADQMGVSRNTVREALRMLEVTGLIRLKKGASGGAFLNDSNAAAVSQTLLDGISLREYRLADLLAIRKVLETYVIEQACLWASEEEIEALAQIAQESVLAEESMPSFERRLDLHVEFHRALARCGHNAVAEVLVEPLLAITRAMHLRAGPVRTPRIHQLRLRLVEALRSRDVDLATSTFAEHITLLGERLDAMASEATA